MGRVINITNKLDREPKFIAIEDKNYAVNCSKNAVLKFMDIEKKVESGELSEIESIDEAVKLFLGVKAFKEIEGMDLSFEGWKIVFFAIIACAMNRDFEEVENSFRDAAGTT